MKSRMNSLPKLMDTRYGVAALASAAIFSAGCGSDNKAETTSSAAQTTPQEQRAGPTGDTPQQLAASIIRISRAAKGKDLMPPPSYCENSNTKPQEVYSKTPAKLIVNTLCQPPLGEPATLYDTPSFSGEPTGTVRDGDVVQAKCIDPNGEATRTHDGVPSESTTWVQVTKGEVTGYLSEVNLGYVDDTSFKTCPTQ